MKITGAEALIKALEMEKVDVMFGYPAAAFCPPTTRCFSRRSATSSCATNRAPVTWPRAMPTSRAARVAEHDVDFFHFEGLDEGLGAGDLHVFLLGIWLSQLAGGRFRLVSAKNLRKPGIFGQQKRPPAGSPGVRDMGRAPTELLPPEFQGEARVRLSQV